MRKKLCSAAVCCLVLFLTACGLASQASVAALVERDVQALEALAGEIALAGAAGDAMPCGPPPPLTQNIREWTASLMTAVPDRYSLNAGSRALHPRQAIMVSIIRPGMFRWASAAQGI